MPPQALIFYPDARLRIRADPVSDHGTAMALAAEVFDTLRSVGAIGLTAPHIGRLTRIAVIRPQPDAPCTTYLDPQIVWSSDERGPQIEGSVSMPGISEPVERAARIRVRYRNMQGIERQEDAEGFHAACLQHEIDQLDGIFWIDRLTRVRRDRALKRYAKLRRA